MRIAYFTTGGELAVEPLRGLLEAGFEVALIVRPAGPSRLRSRLAGAARRAGLLAGDAVSELARRRGIAELRARERAGPDLLRALGEARPDLLCVSTYRWVLPHEVLGTARLGGLNLHSSLLPRHRGPLPLFWTYHSDDRVAGVSVHRLTESADGGDVLLQDGAALPRGHDVEQLNRENARRGAALLPRAVAALSAGAAEPAPQDEARATRAPLLRAGAEMIDFDGWSAERVWHFLAGLRARYREPLRDARGEPVRYAGVAGWEPAAEGSSAIGRVDVRGERGALRCRDGWVHLDLESR